jgi:hypothetical protein
MRDQKDAFSLRLHERVGDSKDAQSEGHDIVAESYGPGSA